MNKFRISFHYQEAGHRDFSLIDYRQKMGGLISKLYQTNL